MVVKKILSLVFTFLCMGHRERKHCEFPTRSVFHSTPSNYFYANFFIYIFLSG
jgi:hypothetical protein